MESIIEIMQSLQFSNEDILDFELNTDEEMLRVVTNEIENLT